MGLNVKGVDASDKFYAELEGVKDNWKIEKKEKIEGAEGGWKIEKK